MGKLHELIAVEPELKQKALKTAGEVGAMFEKGSALFTGQVRTYKSADDGGDKLPDETKNLSANVQEQLAKVQKEFGRWIDAVVSKEVSNTLTSADVVLDGNELFSKLPAPALLNLEAKLETLRGVYAAIPTNDLTEAWKLDPSQGVWVSDPAVTNRSKKVQKPLVLYPATPEHPAQTQLITEDVREGSWTTVKTSGMLSPTEKSDMLSRLDDLLMAVKKARQRANEVVAVDVKVAETIFNYIHGK
jgi:hypothetical protein